MSAAIDGARVSAADVVVAGRAGTLRRIWRHGSGRAGLVLLGAVALLAVGGRVFWRVGPNTLDRRAILQPISRAHPFGTDQGGRDQLARVIHAIPVAFGVPVAAVALALVAGGVIGLVAGYRGGRVERVAMWTMDLLLSLPALLVAIMIVAAFGGGFRNTTLAIAIVSVPRFARIARASAISTRRLPYVDAARLSGTRGWRLLARHVVPAVSPPLLAMTTLSLSTALLTQASLTFVGLGIRPPTAELGSMLAESTRLMTVAPWLAVFPSIVMVALVLGFTLLGDGVRDVVDPRLAARA